MLIGSSSQRVDAGGLLVAEAGQTMSRIVDQVQRVQGLISDISVSTREQTHGIGQVSSAVADLDRMTQQNAALVEQSAAASQSMAQQAARLADSVGAFKLPVRAAA